MSERAANEADEALALLMRTLHDVVEDSGEPEVAERLPWASHWRPHAVPAGPSPPSVDGFPEPIADRCVQAFSLAFQLADHAEENATAQAFRRLEDDGRLDEYSGSWEKAFSALKASNVPEADISKALRALHIEPVLTAHPTEAKRQTVLEHQRRLYRALVDLENSMWTASERSELLETLHAEIERLWRTGEIYLERPSLADERRMILHYLAQIFPLVVPRLERRLRSAWASAGLKPGAVADPGALPRVTFGNWVGGDRDGHPDVTPDFTRETLLLFRSTALDLLDARLSGLAQRLSFSENRVRAPLPLTTRVTEWADELGDEGRAAVERNSDEPWRQYANLLRAALPRSGPPTKGQFRDAGELTAALRELKGWLNEARASRIGEHDVDPLLSLIRTFGFHLAVIDVRQNSAVHDAAVAELLEASGLEGGDEYADWPTDQRRALLDRELETRRPLARLRDLPEGPAREMVTLYRTLEEHRAAYGSAGLGALIVSMTRGTEDLLALYLLGREGGLLSYEGHPMGALPLPVVPLLETIDDLRRAPEILDDYLSHPIVRRSLDAQAREHGWDRPRQQVMVGYSDSGKDGGLVASMWSVHRAQRELVETGRRHGVDLHFFHGRGGTIGRGSGPTHRFVGALPTGSVGPMLRVTEQGETIRQKYANPPTAARQIEMYTASALERTVRDREEPEAPAGLPALMDELYELSFHRYRELVEHPGFVPFFERATPIDAIEHSRIGSRPARRPGERKLGNLRAIPWVFSWNQARFTLPGWYGLGTALKSVQERDDDAFEALRRAKSEAERWAPLHYLVSNAATAVATASPAIMAAYAELAETVPGTPEILEMIWAEFAATREALEAIYGAPLERARPTVHRAIEFRNEALLPLHRRQITLLRRWRRAEGDDAAALVPQLLRTINAISSGLGMTG